MNSGRTSRLGRVALLLVLAPAAAGAGTTVTPAEFRRYLAYDPSPQSYTTEENPVIEALLSPGRDHGIEAAASALARKWAVSRSAASAAIDVVVLANVPSYSSREVASSYAARRAAAAQRLSRTAAESAAAWAVVRGYLDAEHRCDDAEFRDRYLARAAAPDELVHAADYACMNWLLALPPLMEPTALFYARVADTMARDPGGLVALRRFREFAASSEPALPPAVQRYAIRSYWSALIDAGLPQLAVEDARTLPAPRVRDLLSCADPAGAVALDGVVLADADRADSACDLQAQWILALISTDHEAEARDWVRLWQWPHSADVPDGDGIGKNFALRRRLRARAGLRAWLERDPAADPFTLLVGDGVSGLLWQDDLGNGTARHAFAARLRAAGYPALSDDVLNSGCAEAPAPANAWSAFPASFQHERDALQALLPSRGDNACGREAFNGPVVPVGWAEYPLSRLRNADHRRPLRSPTRLRGLADLAVVRSDTTGPAWAALTLSQDLDPAGEVTGGSYWLQLSNDRGRSWRSIYLGLPQYQPYEVVTESHVPIVDGDKVRIAVRIRELDPNSISFPPVGLAVRRSVDGLYVERSLADLTRDSDHDGLTDLFEAALGTDPQVADTDGDGLRDDVDSMPQVAATAEPWEPALMTRVLADTLGFDAGAIGTGGPRAADDTDDPLAAAIGTPSRRSAQGVLFLVGEKAQFGGLRAPTRVVVLSPLEVSRRRQRFGVFFPVRLSVFCNHASDACLVQWDASWVGGRLFYAKKDGVWQPPVRNGWIS